MFFLEGDSEVFFTESMNIKFLLLFKANVQFF